MSKFTRFASIGLVATTGFAWLADWHLHTDSDPFNNTAEFVSVLNDGPGAVPTDWFESVPLDWPSPAWSWRGRWLTASVEVRGTDHHWDPRSPGGFSGSMPNKPQLDQRAQFLIETGFPFRSLRSVHTFGLGGQDLRNWRTGVPVDAAHWPVVPRLVSLPPRTLAIMPILPGFFADTLFFTVLAGLSDFGIRRIYRKLNHPRPGRCSACGYRLMPAQLCPECGAGRPA